MIEYNKNTKDNVTTIRITGAVTEKEHQQIDQLLTERIARYKRIRLIIVAEHYRSFNSDEAFFEDLRMIKLHADSIDRLAIIGDHPWKTTWVGIFGLFSGLETQYFLKAQIKEAWQWINN